MRQKLFIMMLSLFALCGCSREGYLRSTMERLAPDDDEALAKEFLSALRTRDFKMVTDLLDPQLVQEIESNLDQGADMLNHGKLVSFELAGCEVFSTLDKKRSRLTYQYQFTNAWVLAEVTIETAGVSKKVIGISLNPIPKSLGEQNAFTLSGKGIQHYVLLIFAVVVPVFVIWTVVLCARAKIRKKWLWIAFILAGITKLNLTWTTGQMDFHPIAFQIPGAGVMKMGLYAPWILTVSFPLGAILFMVKRRKLQSVEERENTEP